MGSVGVHPDEVGALNEENFARMRELLKKEKIVAVGEIGLDYYWDKEGMICRNIGSSDSWILRER